MINEIVYKKLIEVAKKKGGYDKGIITYSELNLACNLGIVFEGDAGRKEIGIILGDISRREFENKRPLISCVVIRKNSHPIKASDGFYKLAEKLGLKESKEDEQLFFSKELTLVHDYWKNK